MMKKITFTVSLLCVCGAFFWSAFAFSTESRCREHTHSEHACSLHSSSGMVKYVCTVCG
ncbi:MAG: hypothetical protein LUD68_09890 [Rikenellaceae bacterium]|nr:hypothetical protein [Rikenellaceae bacterium]